MTANGAGDKNAGERRWSSVRYGVPPTARDGGLGGLWAADGNVRFPCTPAS